MEIIQFNEGMTPECGKCYSGMSNEDYHHKFTEFFSSSDLKNALRSVEYFWQELTRKKEREYKVAFENGSAFHDAIESLIVHDDLRLFEQNTISYEGTAQAKKKFLTAKEANPDKNVIPESMFKNVPIMAEKFMLPRRFSEKILEKMEFTKNSTWNSRVNQTQNSNSGYIIMVMVIF